MRQRDTALLVHPMNAGTLEAKAGSDGVSHVGSKPQAFEPLARSWNQEQALSFSSSNPGTLVWDVNMLSGSLSAAPNTYTHYCRLQG